MWALGRELFGTDAGRAAALTFITMQGVFLHARLPLPDMLMTALIAASLWVYTVALRRGGMRWVAFYALVGAAFWAKGPAGLMPLVVAAVDAIRRFKGAWWRRARFAHGLLVVVLVISPWFVLGLLADRAALNDAIVADQLRWYAPVLPTVAAVVAPLQNVWGVLFPWVIVLPLVVAQALRIARGRGAERDHVVFILTWAIVTVVVVAVSREQRMRYYLPLAVPVALLTGWCTPGQS